MNVVRQFAKAVLTTCVPRRLLLVRGPVTRNQSPTLALTFDDGPHPEHTPRLLDRLQELGLVATFFVIGRYAEKYPDLIRRMAADGHEVANHTYSHSEPGQTSAKTFLEEVERTDERICRLIGRVTTTVRPPKGELNWSKLRGLWRIGKTVALWNVDPKDFSMTSSMEMMEWCRRYKPRPGDTVLLHDNHPHAVCAVDSMASLGTFERFETTTIHQWVVGAERQVARRGRNTESSHATFVRPSKQAELQCADMHQEFRSAQMSEDAP